MSEQVNIAASIIICPKCKARYEIASDTLGDTGRQVRCAQCQTDWKAVAEDASHSSVVEVEKHSDVAAVEEQALDDAFEENQNPLPKVKTINSEANSDEELEREPESAKDTKVDPQVLARQRKDMARRQSLVNRTLPRARLRRAVRVIGASILAVVFIGSIFMRESLVRSFPDLAGIYEPIGLGVNIIGLEFSDVKTLRSLRNGVEVMEISAGIKSVSSRQISVPPIIVTLLDDQGNSVFEWSVTARAAIMLPGEWIEFETQLTSPPAQSSVVQLMFEDTK